MESKTDGYSENGIRLFYKADPKHMSDIESGADIAGRSVVKCVIDPRSPQESQQLLMLGRSRPLRMVNQ